MYYKFAVEFKYIYYILYLEKLKKRNSFVFRSIELWIVVKKEEIGQANIKEFRHVPIKSDKVQSLLPAVTASKEGLRYLVLPYWPCVSQYR